MRFSFSRKIITSFNEVMIMLENKKVTVLFFLGVMALAYIMFGAWGLVISTLVLFLRGDGRKD